MNTNIFDSAAFRCSNNNDRRPPHFHANDGATQPFNYNSYKNVRAYLAALNLVILRDAVTGALCSKDGRKNDERMLAAELIAKNYHDPLYVRLRQIACTEQCSGLISPVEVKMSYSDLVNSINTLTRIGIFCGSYREYPQGLYVQINPEARSFLNKQFYQMCVNQYLKNTFSADELYYDVTLSENRNLNERYKIDVISRIDTTVRYILISMNPRLHSNFAQIDKLARTINRLGRAQLTIICSPQTDIITLSSEIRSRLGYGASIPNIVPFTRLPLIR